MLFKSPVIVKISIGNTFIEPDDGENIYIIIVVIKVSYVHQLMKSTLLLFLRMSLFLLFIHSTLEV